MKNKTKRQKYILTASKIVLVIAFLNIFAFTVRHVLNGGERLGILTKPFKSFIEFPLLINQMFVEIEDYNKCKYFIPVDSSFTRKNLLNYDIYALNAHTEKRKYVYNLRNLRTDSVLKKWVFRIKQFKGSAEVFPVSAPNNPILLDDGSLIGMIYGTKNLFRLNEDSEIVWHNSSGVFHHSMELSHDNYLWTSTFDEAYTYHKPRGNLVPFEDNKIVKVDINTGKIIFERSLADILISNGYRGLLHGYGNEEYSLGQDLFHLNDVQPIKTDGKHWEKGDILLSLRHRSMIVHYRPENDSVLRIISGPFIEQHDVDIYSENEISLFNNNRAHTESVKIETLNEFDINKVKDTIKGSDIVIYNFEDSSFRKPFVDLIRSEDIYTERQGTHKFLNNGDLFLEATESGKVYILNESGFVYKNYLNPFTEDGEVEYPHWVRIYKKSDLENVKGI